MVTGTVNASVLGSAVSDLVLRVRGTNHNGQLLRLKSAKCTIGSGPNCTLRLRGRGISQIHCLILRGPNGTVIRRWSPDTRLNGRSFTEAPLSAGDRLSIGSLEFEIIATSEIADGSPGADGFYPHQYQQYPIQSELPKDLQLESEQLNARRRRTEQEEEILDQRAKQLEDAAAALRVAQNKAEEERRQWEDLRSASLSEQSGQRVAAEDEQLARLKTQWAELESQRQTWTLQQQQWRAEQELSHQNLQDAKRQLNERTAELDSLAADLEIRKSQLDVQSAAFELQNKQLADQAAVLASHAAKNNDHSGELDARNVQLDARAAELQAQAAELAGRSAQLDAQAAELEMKTDELKKQSAKLQSQSDNLQTRSAELESKQSNLETESSQLETERNRREESYKAREKTLATREEEIDQKADRLQTLQARLHAEKEDWQLQLAQQHRERELYESELTERASNKGLSPSGEAPAVDGSLPPQSDKAPADSYEAPAVDGSLSPQSDKAPADPGDLLRSFGRDIDKPEETDGSAADETADGGSPRQASAHEEESVDDYMARLMQRIRSTQGELGLGAGNPYASASSRPESAPLPLETASVPPPAPVRMPAKRGEPVEMSPHTVAPEKQVDITLLRNLAKYSAHNALGAHARQLMTRVMYSKLAVALMGGFTGIVLLFVWRMWFTNSLTFFSAMMSFVVAIIWGAQYVLLTVKLLINGSDNLGSMQAFHQTSEDGKTPGEHHTISEIAGEDNAGKDKG